VNSMREVISGTLWIGNALDARDVTGVEGLGSLPSSIWPSRSRRSSSQEMLRTAAFP
jgi:hypothetical protein